MEPMDVSDIRVQQNAELGGYEAKVSGHWLTNGDGGHFIEVTGWGNTEARARQELAEALRRVDFGLPPDDDPRGEVPCAA